MRYYLLVGLVTAAALLAGCGDRVPVEIPGITGPKASDEEQIAAVLDDINRGLQSRSIYKVLAHVSRNYQDPKGRDYEGLKASLSKFFKEYGEIRITRPPPRILVQGRRARVVETFGVSARPLRPDIEPINMQGQVNVFLEKVGDAWQLVGWGDVL